MKRSAALRVILILALALWSAGLRAHAGDRTAVEICAADGPRTLVLGADGAPVSEKPDCERCLLCAALTTSGSLARTCAGRQRARRALAACVAPGRRHRRGRRARAPPGARRAPT